LNGIKWTSDAEVIAKRSLPFSFEKEAKSSKNGLKALIKGNFIERVEWRT